MKKTSIIVLFFMSLLTFGQVTDDFSDGDFSANPTWTADNASNWTVSNGQLRSNSSALNSSFYISTPSAKAMNAEWSFFVNLQFNTSSVNYADVYLMSEQSNLSSAANNGYFVRIGGTPDEISLYKITAGMPTILINGTDGVTNTSNNSLRIKVIRNVANQWSLLRDAGGTDFVSEGTVADNSFTTSAFSGIKIQQSTASFVNRHFFDDIYAGDIIVDTTPPTIQLVQVVNQNSLSLTFSEKLDIASAQNALNYTVNNSIGYPSSAILLADGKTVQLTFPLDFQNAVNHLIAVQLIKDITGNSISTVEKSFQYFKTVPSQLKDILITEIMADPTPVVQLPEAEFIEIHNRSAYAFDLAGWKLSDATSTATLSSTLLLPGSFLVLTSTSNATKFSPDVKVLAVTSFPSLNNDGESLILRNATGVTIDSVNYSSTWYHDDEKKDGGWSLELIDITNICGEEDNWVVSEDEQGGSPGKLNSVSANKPDLTGPQLQRVTTLNSHQLLFQFSKKLQKPINVSSFLFSPEVKIEKAFFTDLSLRQIQIDLGEELKVRQLYAVHLVNVYDCNGNAIQEGYSHTDIALPEMVDSLDLVINEVLFNPRTGGVDFVEVYNRSQKYINLKNAKLTDYEGTSSANPKIITTTDYIFRPGDYVVFTTDGEILKNHYPQSISEKFLRSDLPGLPDDEGSIALVSDEGKMIDLFSYTEKMHSPIIKEEEGVSLERISFTQPTNDIANWRSATASSGYATPGFINSNTRSGEQIVNGEVQVAPEIFSIEMPGNDFAQIQYKFEESGYIANVKIYDQQGRVVKEIVNNGTISYDGVFRWDGDRDDGTKAKSGYYLVWFEAFNTNGTLKTFRKRVIIASR